MQKTNSSVQESNSNKNNLIHQIYLRYAWGAEEKLELLNEASRFVAQAQAFALYEEIECAINTGCKAYKQGQYLDSILNSQGLGAAQVWIESVLIHQDRKVQKHLIKILEKWKVRQQQLKERADTPVYSSVITPVVFSGYHPNSLRHLKPASDWAVYIDETGQTFGQTVQGEEMPGHQLGRIVALAVPARTQLDALATGYHATEASPQDVDKTLEYLLAKDVGIFGFTVNDPGAFAGNWFSHVVLLVRWVLLQLPIDVSSKTKVSFMIERNDARLAYQSIDNLANLLEGELRAIDAVRFSTVQINAALMNKEHPMNGYVDTLAFTWGSPSAVSKDRLKKTALLGHCFLRPDQQAMDRLYLSVGKGNQLLAPDWFALCNAVAYEPDKGLLGHYLHQFGERTKMDFKSWQYYLSEVSERLRSKNYKLTEVSQALDWLEKYIPEGGELPAIYRLPLETTRLGQENHLGKVNLERLQSCLQLINQLEEEDAQQACGALLRVAVSGSNSFEFKILKSLLVEWLNKPIAVSGLANYARLHSSLGQVHAFCNEPEKAIVHFNEALTLFDRLSDKQRANREKKQTNAYRIISLMDEGQVGAEALLAELANSANLESYSRSLAISGQSVRYPHHLWLRALLRYPNVSLNARKAYLEQSHEWQYGEDHPWGLIEAYRAWLYQLDGKEHLAAQRMSSAIRLCANTKNGPVLWWMAEVLRALAQALGLYNVELPSAEERSYLRRVLPAAPHEQLSGFAETKQCNHQQLLSRLKLCLPFNFH